LLIDWLWVGENSLWIIGLAFILACLSWANWLAIKSRVRLSTVVLTPLAQVWLNLGVGLLGAGLFFAARSVPERIVWAAFLFSFVVWGLAALRAERSTKLPVSVQYSGIPPARACFGPVKRAVFRVVQMEPWLLLCAMPFAMFPQRFTPVLLFVLGLPWLARKLTLGYFTARTPMDGPILVLLLMLPVSLWASVDLQRSMPSFCGIILGMAVFYGMVNHVHTPGLARRAGVLIVLAGLAVSVLALPGTAWHPGKLYALPQTYSFLTNVRSRLGPLGYGFNPNMVAGTLCLFVPFVASLLLLGCPMACGTSAVGSTNYVSGSTSRRPAGLSLPSSVLAISLLVMLGVLALTQSRAALIGVGVGLLVIAGFRWHWRRAAVPLVVVAAALGWRLLSGGGIKNPVLAVSGEQDLVVRYEIWQRAIYMIQDFPWTGVGLNTFPLVANALYPFFSVAPAEVLRISHAHNVFLQVAVDLGVPGLVAYVALLLGFGYAWWTAYRGFLSGAMGALSVGLLSAMVAYHVYGLFHCMPLGAKPDVVIWVMLGLMAALANLSLTGDGTGETKGASRSSFI